MCNVQICVRHKFNFRRSIKLANSQLPTLNRKKIEKSLFVLIPRSILLNSILYSFLSEVETLQMSCTIQGWPIKKHGCIKTRFKTVLLNKTQSDQRVFISCTSIDVDRQIGVNMSVFLMSSENESFS